MSTVEKTRAAAVAVAVRMDQAVSETAQLLRKLLDGKVDLPAAMEANARMIYNAMRIDKPEKLVETSNTMKRK